MPLSNAPGVAFGSAGESLECATMAKASGMPPAMAIVERLTSTQCRFRTTVIFQPGTRVALDLNVAGIAKVSVEGQVLSFETHDARNVHTLRLVELTEDEKTAIARATAEISRRQAIPGPDQLAANGLTRSSVRVPTNFTLRYAIDGEDFKPGVATNISIGGVFMVCVDHIVVGSSLELRFTLPADAHGGASQEITTKARIVAHPADSTGANNYNIAFYGLAATQRDAIARYVDDAPKRAAG